MEKLIRGLLEFRRTALPALLPRLQSLAERQAPKTLFMTCSDSRVVPNLMVSTEPGDLFVSRTVGNLVPRADENGASTGDFAATACIEFALHVLHVDDVIVCGHSRCGAMKALLEQLPASPDLAHLAGWLEHARPSLDRLRRMTTLDPALPEYDQLSQANVLTQIDHVLSYPQIRDRVVHHDIGIHAWWWDIATGDLHIYDREEHRFALIDERMAERMLQRRSWSP